ncbi:MAG: tetratricopeptide repeat protein [Pirellulaceae bacterium]|nr:tetratricopeptide repeat protein [Pirellulaceae bacterium]
MLRNASLYLCLSIVTLAVYGNVAHHEYLLLDDREYVANNRHVSTGLTWENICWALTSTHASNWHPLTWVSHMVDCQLFGADAPGCYHLVNLCLHIGNTIGLCWILQRMTGCFWRPAFVAAVFAWHPLHVESVAWISERKDVLAMFLWLISIGCYVEFVRQKRWSWYVISCLVLVLALLSKPMPVTAPFLLLLFDVWPLRRLVISSDMPHTVTSSIWYVTEREKKTKRHIGSWLIIEKIPMLVTVLAVSVTTFVVQHGSGSVQSATWSIRFITTITAYVRYLWHTVWPVRLAVLYPADADSWPLWQIMAAVVVLIGITVLVLRSYRRPYMLVGWFWYLGTLVPVIGFVTIGYHSMADRYTYMPMTGLLVMVAWAIGDVVDSQPTYRLSATWGAAVILLACAWLCHRQVGYWRDSETLFERTLEVTASNYVIHNNLGAVYLRKNRRSDAIYHYERAIQINHLYAQSYVNLGAVLASQGLRQKAIQNYRRALNLSPKNSRAHNNLANAFRVEGRWEEAMHHFREAIENDPDSAIVHENIGDAFRAQSHFDEAIVHYRQVIQLVGEDARMHYRIGQAFGGLGEHFRAMEYFERALQLDSTMVDAAVDLGISCLQVGMYERAIEVLRQVIKQHSRHVDAHLNLGTALHLAGKSQQAVSQFQQVLNWYPDHAKVHNNLGVIYQAMGQSEKARESYQRAFELDPQDATAKSNLDKLKQD